MPKTPTYITKRGAIYYFQYSVPRHIPANRRLIRKSLNTSNIREALARARKLWVKMADFNLDWENDDQFDQGMYMRGRTIAKDMDAEGITDPQSAEFEAYISSLQPYELKALSYFDERSNAGGSGSQRSGGTHLDVGTRLSSEFSQLKLGQRGIKTTGIPLSELLKEFIAIRAKDLTKMSDTLRDYESTIKRLIMFIGDLPNEQITAEILEKKYILRRRKLPTNYNRKAIYFVKQVPHIDMVSGEPRIDAKGKVLQVPIYKPIEEILSIAQSQKDAKFPSERTIRNEFGEVAAFFRHFEIPTRGKIEKGLGDFMAENQGDRGETTVTHFTDSELTKIFNSEYYTNGFLQVKPHYFWLPLIALFQGMRIAEVAQLTVNNVVMVDAIWCLQIEKSIELDQSTKNHASSRIVPIHESLIHLGILDYHRGVKRSGELELFPDEAAQGNKTSTWFNNKHKDTRSCNQGFSQLCGVRKVAKVNGVEKKKVFHSLRKSWITAAKKLDLDRDVRRELVGHHVGSTLDVHAQDYEGQYDIPRLKEEIDKIKFDFDLSAIKKWGAS